MRISSNSPTRRSSSTRSGTSLDTAESGSTSGQRLHVYGPAPRPETWRPEQRELLDGSQSQVPRTSRSTRIQALPALRGRDIVRRPSSPGHP